MKKRVFDTFMQKTTGVVAIALSPEVESSDMVDGLYYMHIRIEYIADQWIDDVELRQAIRKALDPSIKVIFPEDVPTIVVKMLEGELGNSAKQILVHVSVPVQEGIRERETSRVWTLKSPSTN